LRGRSVCACVFVCVMCVCQHQLTASNLCDTRAHAHKHVHPHWRALIMRINVPIPRCVQRVCTHSTHAVPLPLKLPYPPACVCPFEHAPCLCVRTSRVCRV
jgi:hypothetical protein